MGAFHKFDKMALRLLRLSNSLRSVSQVRFMAGSEFGSGAGKGGGSGGSIREAGGAFGKMEAAREEEYFKRKEREQLQQLHRHHEQEVKHHAEQIEQHKEAIERHKKKISELKHLSKKDD